MWKDFDELENSLSMNELTAVLAAKVARDTEKRKFEAALQGVDLEKGSNSDGQKVWQDKLKAASEKAGPEKAGVQKTERTEWAEFGIEFDTA